MVCRASNGSIIAPLPPLPSFLEGLYEPFNGPVIAGFYIRREETSGELPFLPVIFDAFTAHTLSAAGFV
jgi:hypothetical protein